MKRTISILAAFAVFFISTAVAFAQNESSVSLDKSVHDFGDIYTDQGPVSCTFTFTNTGSKPILLLSVVASCGCTDVDWTREPIQPGKKGTVQATFDNNDGPYPFDKTVTVYVSDIKKPYVLHLRGSAHENARPLTETYSLKIGNMGVKTLENKIGNLSQRETKSGNIVIANVGITPMKVEFEDVSDGLTLNVYPNPVPAKSVANLTYSIKASRERWGKNWYYATPVIDGRRYKAIGKLPAKENEEGTEHFYSEPNTRVGIGKSEIAFWAVTKENFATLPTDYKNDMANPTFTKSTVNFGKLASGAKTTLTFEYTNKGKMDSEFFKLDADCSNVKVKEMEKTAPGKKGKIVVELDTKGMPKGENIIALNLFTNSPFRPVISLQIAGTIQ
ncbi:MAG: DUF1573 domain-containing protein [Bacteroidales bacterium]|nr:DUF1573 domain-containing protein [Bacteroidales bacterium]